MLSVAEASGDVQCVGITGGTTATPLQGPQRGVYEGSAVLILHLANEGSGSKVVSIDRAVSEIPDQ